MSEAVRAAVSAVGMFVLVLTFIEVGIRLGRFQIRRTGAPEGGTGTVDAAILGLLGLLIGFSFSGAYTRMEDRRALIAVEANAIGTAYLRLDLLAPEAQGELRRLFRRYLEARVESYESIVADFPRYRARVTGLQQEIWSRAVAACGGQPTSLLVLPAINEMIDITTTRELLARIRVPSLIIALLFIVAMVSSLLAGYGMSTRQRRSLLHMFLLAAIIATSIYVIQDLANPRVGLIRLDASDLMLQYLLEKVG